MTDTSIYVLHTQGAQWATLSQFMPMLSPEQQLHINDIKVSEKRLQSLCAHLLLNYALQQLGRPDLCPGASFSDERRPFLPAAKDVHISLSHTADAVAAAVSAVPVGVDIECIRAVRLNLEKLFSDEEKKLFPDFSKNSRLLALWTRREAQFKCTGESALRRAPSRSVSDKRMFTQTLNSGKNGFILSACAGTPFAAPPNLNIMALHEFIAVL